MNASPITKITSWLEFLGKNLHLVGCATVCGKSEVMLIQMNVTVHSSIRVKFAVKRLSTSFGKTLQDRLDQNYDRFDNFGFYFFKK